MHLSSINKPVDEGKGWSKQERTSLAWLYYSLQIFDEQRAHVIEVGDEEKWFAQAMSRLNSEDRETVRNLIKRLSESGV